MPTLGAALNFAQLEGRNFRAHQLSTAPSGPVTGQLYYDTVANTLFWWDGSAWQSAKSPQNATATVIGIVQLANDLGGTAAAPSVVGLHLAADTAINHKLTAITDPTNAQDAATKNYVDAQGSYALSWKQSVKAATTISPTLSGVQTIDSVALVVGDRVLVKDGVPAYVNGVYIVQSGAWTRAPDMTTWAQVLGAMVEVQGGGLTNGSTIWQSTATPGGTLGTTNVNWQAVPSAFAIGSGTGPNYALQANTRLDQIGLSNPATAAVRLNSQNLINVLDPVNPQDAATKNYVDNTAAGLNAKGACLVGTTGANITLSGTQTIDGIAVVAGNRVLVKDQSTPNQNGIYVVAAGAWTRSTDMATWPEVPSAYTWVEQGTVNADTGWVCTSDPGGTLGTTNVVWSQFSGSAVVTAGQGLTKVGNVISALPDNASLDTGGAGSSLEIKAGGVTAAMHAAGSVNLQSTTVAGTLPLANGGTGQVNAKGARETGLLAAGYYSNNSVHGAGTTITITQATHGLRSSRGIHVQVQDNTTGNVEIPDVTVAANGDVTVTYAAALAANSKLVTLVG